MHRRVQMIAVHDPGGKRGVGARAAQVHHQVAGDVRGKARTVLLADDVQGEVESGGDAGAGKDRSVLDEDAVVEHAGTRLDAAQLLDMLVMRSALTSGKQPGVRRN